jgi:hypothetical protein
MGHRLWNPYASALVPEDLVLEVTGLPSGQSDRVRPEWRLVKWGAGGGVVRTDY